MSAPARELKTRHFARLTVAGRQRVLHHSFLWAPQVILKTRENVTEYPRFTRRQQKRSRGSPLRFMFRGATGPGLAPPEPPSREDRKMISSGVDPAVADFRDDIDDIPEHAYETALRIRASLCAAALEIRAFSPDAADRLLKEERVVAGAMREDR
jgi:hypothetical protein